MKIFVGADYRGFDKKERLMRALVADGYEVMDAGAFQYTEGDDYNDPAVLVAQSVRGDAGAGAGDVSEGALGVLICDSAHGMTMQANRFRGVRAANCDSVESARLAREHDDANVVCLSAHFMDDGQILEIVRAFIETPFEPLERRIRRIRRLDEREDYV